MWPLTRHQVFFFWRQKKKKNRLIAGYVAPGRLSLWLEDRNDILMPSSPPPLPSQPLLALKDTVGVLTGGAT